MGKVKQIVNFDIVEWLKEFDTLFLSLSDWKMKLATKLIFTIGTPSAAPPNMWTLDIMNRMVGEQWLKYEPLDDPDPKHVEVDYWKLTLPNGT